MNDICNVFHLCTILYVDDTSVVANDKNFDKLLEIPLDFNFERAVEGSILTAGKRLSLKI